MISAADYTAKESFPPDDKDGRKISDDETEIVQAGTWRVDRDVIIREMENNPKGDMIQRLAPNDVLPSKK